MNLTRTTVLLAAIASSLACHDSAGPPPTPPVSFMLENINGRSLPTYLSPIPEAPTVVSARMLLEASGQATFIEHHIAMVRGDATDTTNYTYKITGNEIQFEPVAPCPPDALCIAPPRGTINSSRMALDMSGGMGAVVYNFRFIAPD